MKASLAFITMTVLLFSCSFQAKRVGMQESDERALEITDKWVQKDTEQATKDILDKMEKHRGLKRYLRTLGRDPVVFVGEIQNLTSEAYFPISEINDELLNEISASGEMILVDQAARESLLKEITYQNDGMVDGQTAKKIGRQVGADLIIFGSVYMQPRSRDGRTIKQYSVNIRITDIERGVEVLRVRSQLSKYSEQSSFGF